MLTWEWDEKVGTVTFEQRYDGVKRFTYDLYKGNAYLIMITEWEENGKRLYNLVSFFSDKSHMETLLGIGKKDGENYFDSPEESIVAISLNKGKLGAKQTKEIVSAFSKAFNNIDISITT